MAVSRRLILVVALSAFVPALYGAEVNYTSPIPIVIKDATFPIKTVPYIPLSQPFVERLIGTIRREYLDRTLFWTTVDLETKLLEFRDYFNSHSTHHSLAGRTPTRSELDWSRI